MSFDKLYEKLIKLSTPDGLLKGMERSVDLVKETAELNAPENTGTLKTSFQTSVKKDGRKLTGEVYTDSPYAAYVEFGTGPRGAESDKSDVSPNVHPVYKNKGWIIPASAMSIAEAEKYHLLVIRNKNKEVIGYATRGQAAQPFLYPALRDNEREIKEIFKEELIKDIKKKAGGQ